MGERKLKILKQGDQRYGRIRGLKNEVYWNKNFVKTLLLPRYQALFTQLRVQQVNRSKLFPN